MKKRIALLSLIVLIAITAIIFIRVNSDNESEMVSLSNKSETNEKDDNEKVSEMLTFKDFWGDSNVEVTKIEIISGDTGQGIILTDKEEINHIFEFLNDLQFRDINEKNKKDGWDYIFNIYSSDDKYISILPQSEKWDINSKFYKVFESENSKYSISEELNKIKSRLEE